MEENFIDYSESYDTETVRYLEEEFTRLKDNCYLDHAGATLYSKTQMINISDDLCSSLYGNPHSLGTASKLTLDVIDQIRFRVLDHFQTNSDEYSVVFTSGATDSIRLLSESFNFFYHPENGPGNFVYLQDSHTSVLGMREIVAKKGANIFCLGHDEAFRIFHRTEEGAAGCGKNNDNTSAKYSLFVYPAQCNFSGLKYPLDWIHSVRDKRTLDYFTKDDQPSDWFTLLDAASYVPTNHLNLTEHTPDFVSVSFYKIFGYPTGLGALLVKKTAEKSLDKIYYGGGTVQISLSSELFHRKRSVLHERFEDGTLPFLSIISLRHGFDVYSKIPREAISRHVFSLAKYLHHNLLVLHHSNGSPLAKLYGDTDYEDDKKQGGIVSFNLLRSNGENIGFVEFLNMANLHKIHVRTGCFCNPGACQRHLNLSNEELRGHFNAGHVCGDERDLVEGKPTGGIRVSFGYMSTISEVRFLINFVKNCFLNGPEILKIPDWWNSFRIKVGKKYARDNSDLLNGGKLKVCRNLRTSFDDTITDFKHLSTNTVESGTNIRDEKSLRLKKLFVYPVKSCGSYEINDSWMIGDKGLAYDREWMITTASGVCLTQKQEIKLCLIKPNINRSENILELSYPGMPPVKIPLKIKTKDIKTGALCRSKICGHRVEGIDCGTDVSEWLSLTLGRPGLRLVKQNEAKSTPARKTPDISFSSQAQYLLINQSSIDWLAEKIPDNSSCDKDTILDRFRGNIIVEGCEPFEESKWRNVSIGNTEFKVEGQCNRCQMICIDQKTGEKTIEPLRTLAEEFHGKMKFGIYLSKGTNGNGFLKIGERVFRQ